MRCSVAGCGEQADVVATRPRCGLVMLLCWDHGRAAAEGLGVSVRALRARIVGTRGA